MRMGAVATGGEAAGVGHHVVLSIVNTDRMPENGYFRAKVEQEWLVAASGIPHTVVRATRFPEFFVAVAATHTGGDTVRLVGSGEAAGDAGGGATPVEPAFPKRAEFRQ